MKSFDGKQKIEFFIFMMEMVCLMIEEYRKQPSRECMAAIDNMIADLNEWLSILMKDKGICMQISFPQLFDPSIPFDAVQLEIDLDREA
jgi:hypothetical protein